MEKTIATASLDWQEIMPEEIGSVSFSLWYLGIEITIFGFTSFLSEKQKEENTHAQVNTYRQSSGSTVYLLY